MITKGNESILEVINFKFIVSGLRLAATFSNEDMFSF